MISVLRKGYLYTFSYHKFTRGKDLSRYSSTDLDCILGSQAVTRKRRQKSKNAQTTSLSEPASPSAGTTAATSDVGVRSASEANSEDDGGEDAEKEDEKTAVPGLVTINRGSVNDYFAKKLAALQETRQKGAPGREKIEEEVLEGGDILADKSKRKKKKQTEERESVSREEDVEEAEKVPKKRKKGSKDLKVGSAGCEKKARRCKEGNDEKGAVTQSDKSEKPAVEEQDSRLLAEKIPRVKKRKGVKEIKVAKEVESKDKEDKKAVKSKKKKRRSKEKERPDLKRAEIPGFKGANLLQVLGYTNHASQSRLQRPK